MIKIDEFIPHVLKNPAHYNVQILPQDIKDKVVLIFNNHIEWILSYIKENPPLPPTKDQMDKWGDKLNILSVPHITGHVKLDMLINELKNCITYMKIE